MSHSKNILSLDDKIKIIRSIEAGKKQIDVSKEFRLPRTTVNSLWTRRKRILENFESKGMLGSRKRLRESKHPELESVLLHWFKQVRDENIAINGPILKAKAEQFAKKMKIENFVCSEGWLNRFKDRHGIAFRAISGESGCVPNANVVEWKKDLHILIKDYEAKNIFNVDETGLFYKMQPSKTLHFKREKCTGGKHSKVRISVLIGANCDGSEKLPLLVIGKAIKPRCFKGVKSLPTKYDANSKAWMTKKLFEKYTYELDNRFVKEKRKILLFLDNCAAHPQQIPGLKAIKLIFFPPNCTSVLQPMDQGIIKSLKAHYRRIQLVHMIHAVDNSESPDVNVLKAMEWIQRAWTEVSSETICNCFHHSGFEKGFKTDLNKDDDDLACLKSTIEAATAAGCDTKGLDAETFANFDDDLIVSEKLSDDDIIATVFNKDQETVSDSDEEEENIPPPTTREVQKMLSSIRRYYQSKSDVKDKIFESVAKLENDVVRRSFEQLSQKKVTDYFK